MAHDDNTIEATLAEAGLDAVSTHERAVGMAHGANRVGQADYASLQTAYQVLEHGGQPASIKALLAEVQYWREHQACELDALLVALDKRSAPKAFLVERIFNTYSGLKSALAGQFFGTCAGCGQQIWPGEVQVPFNDVEMHARCWVEGDPAWADREVKAGDQVKADPESLELEEGEPARDYVIAFAATNLFTAEEIQERVRSAHDVLAQAGRV